MKPPILPQWVDPALTGILIRETKAHEDEIVSIAKIDLEDANGIITTSKDQMVRTWSLDLDLMGNINSDADRQDKKWSFKSQ
jgi:hypothetical protein